MTGLGIITDIQFTPKVTRVQDKAETDVVDRYGQSTRRGGIAWKDKKFHLGHAEFQPAMDHPIRFVRQAVGAVGLNGGVKSGEER